MNKVEVEKILKELKEESMKVFTAWSKLNDKIENLKHELTVFTMTFGKHTGKPLSEVPKDYIMWLFANGTLDKYENKELKEALKRIYKELEKENE